MGAKILVNEDGLTIKAAFLCREQTLTPTTTTESPWLRSCSFAAEGETTNRKCRVHQKVLSAVLYSS